jgi:hypothetical protein
VLALGGAALSSPKQTTAERRSSLFPYYAGFSEAFVRDVIEALQAVPGQVVLDPWNGSGTTTTVAKQTGLSSIGIDINPAMAVVAKARLATEKNIFEARQLLKHGSRNLSQEFLVEACWSPYGSATRSCLLLAIFRLVRRRRAIASITKVALDAELLELRSKLSIVSRGGGRVSLLTSDILAPDLPKFGADIIITSPPYLTRIDYVKATLPELLVLSLLEDLPFDELRQAMIGSPVVGRGPEYIQSGIGAYAKSVLLQIGAHKSKASSTYYLAFFTAYISKMFSAFEKLATFARPGTSLVLVVQGSHYKEIFVDLAKLSIDFAASTGFSFVSRADYNFKQSFAQLNPKANGYNSDTANETALLFRRSL